MKATLLVHSGAICDISTEYLQAYYMDQISSGSTFISFLPLEPSVVRELHSSVPVESVKSTMPGNAKILTCDDIVEVEQKRAAKVGATAGERGWGPPKSSKPGEGKRSNADELEIGNREIKALGLEKYCSVLQFEAF